MIKRTYALFIIFVILLTGCGRDEERLLKDLNKIFKVTYINGSGMFAKKAVVYESYENLKDTVKIVSDYKKPTDIKLSPSGKEYSLIYPRHIVLIYEGNDNMVYIQESSRKYVYRNGFSRLYRPYPNSISRYSTWYLASSIFRRDSSRYGSWYRSSSSNRQGSRSSRRSFGGGTSFGK